MLCFHCIPFPDTYVLVDRHTYMIRYIVLANVDDEIASIEDAIRSFVINSFFIENIEACRCSRHLRISIHRILSAPVLLGNWHDGLSDGQQVRNICKAELQKGPSVTQQVVRHL